MKRTFLFPALSVLFFFSACGHQAPEVTRPAQESVLGNQVIAEQQITRDVSFGMEVIAESDDEFMVRVALQNPSRHQLTSFRSWVAFSPELVRAAELNFAEDAPLKIAAPGENTIANQEGMVRIGFSLDDEYEATEEMEIATIRFQKISNSAVSLNFFDVREGGHTDALIFDNSTVRSVLNPNSIPPLVVQ